PLVVRAQMGPDIDANGNAINNSFAPLPTTITDVSKFKTLPGGANALAAPGTIRLSLSGLPKLTTRRYAVWLFNRTSKAFKSAPAKVGTSTTPAATFDSPGEAALSVVLDDASNVDFAKWTHLLVSIEGTTVGANPSASKFLFSEYLAADQSLKAGALTLGKFDATAPRAFQLAGTGLGSFFRDSLLVDLKRVPAPPEGFHYQSFLAKVVGPNVTASVRLHTVTVDEIGNGTDRIAEAEAGAFVDFNTYMLVLEPDNLNLLTKARVQVSENYGDKFKAFFAKQ
ncbi:MAG: hypothetical protein HY703_11355, partial [Gemmatimonadetes bacterium]|nr:hypothetical protein [Gemmatimonadota bacterium]